MGRRGRSTVEHSTASKAKAAMEGAAGVADALEKVKEMNAAEQTEEEEVIPVAPGLRDLVLFGKVVEEVNIGGHVIRMSTLTNRQQKELVKKLVKLDNEDRLMNVKAFTLVEAIISIDNVSLEDLYTGDSSDMTVDEIRTEVVSEFQANLVERLFDKYEKLVEKSNGFFDDGDLGDAVKN